MKLEVINPDRPDVRQLIDHADSLMLAMYPPQSNHLDGIEELTKPNVCFAGVFIDQQLAGIGAVKIHYADPPYGEIKRVFVNPKFRGRKLAIKLMAYLENHLIRKKIALVRLETGDKQTEAIGLYKKLDYKIRGPYGEYIEDPLSVFMEKELTLIAD